MPTPSLTAMVITELLTIILFIVDFKKDQKVGMLVDVIVFSILGSYILK